MDSSEPKRSHFQSFKSKKILQSSSVGLPKPADPSPWSSKTPEKPPNPPRRSGRIRNRGAALSLKDVKDLAKGLQEPKESRSNHEIGSEMPVAKPLKQIKSRLGKWKKPDSPIKLPDEFEKLVEFFNSMDSSIRLLRMKGSMPTFTNIARKIECLTDRRFSYGHLARMKFILPEVIETNKVLILDEQTKCMKPDLRITLNVDALENEEKCKSQSGNLHLRKVFKSRLADFFKAHPEANDIPLATLPEPFYRSKQGVHINTTKDHNTTQPSTTSDDALSPQRPAIASHLSQSFCRKFSKKPLSNETDMKQQNLLEEPPQPSGAPIPVSLAENLQRKKNTSPVAPTSIDLSPRPIIEKHLAFEESLSPLSQSLLPKTPSKEMASLSNEGCSTKKTDFFPTSKKLSTPSKLTSTTAKLTSTPAKIMGSPTKLVYTPAKIASVTPDIQPPKRCWMSCDDCSTSSSNKLVRRPHRPLVFNTPVKGANFNDEEQGGSLSVDNDVLDILSENLVQSIRDKERKLLEEQDPAISQAKRRQELVAALPKLFNIIHYFFQSVKRSVVSKEELVQKIIANHVDIVDRGEVEEQLKLLQELVPEWLCEKLASSGDHLLCINKRASPDRLRARLTEAK